MTLEDVVGFLKKVPCYYFATIKGEEPSIRPFGTATLFEGRLYIQTGKKKEVAHELALNPHGAICAFFAGKWIRIEGTLVEDPRLEAQAALLKEYPSLKNLYKAGDGNTIVYYFKDGTARLCSFAGPDETLHF